jgi:putative membrane protein
MWHMDDGMGWWMLLGSVWFVFFWGLVIWVVLRVTSGLGRSTTEASPLDIARTRYARGEISRDEFELLRRDLT